LNFAVNVQNIPSEILLFAITALTIFFKMSTQSFLYLSPSPFLASKAGGPAHRNLYLSYYPFGIRCIKENLPLVPSLKGRQKGSDFKIAIGFSAGYPLGEDPVKSQAQPVRRPKADNRPWLA